MSNFCIVDQDSGEPTYYDTCADWVNGIKAYGNTSGQGYEAYFLDGSTWKSMGGNYIGNVPKNPPS